MDGVIQFGPLMLASDRLLAIMALWLFLAMGAWIGARTATPAAGRAAWIAVAAGVLAARMAYVAENRAAFAVEPWAVIAFWQGGFNAWAGVVGAAFAIAALLGRQWATGALLASLAGLALAHSGLTHWLAEPGRPLPQGMVLTRMNGKPLPLDALRGQPFVLNLWATWCPPCRREMPMLAEAAGHSDVPVLLVNQREPLVAIDAFLKRENLPASAVVLDPVGALGKETGSPALPTTLFVDAAGHIRTTHTGEISRAALVAAIRDLERHPE